MCNNYNTGLWSYSFVLLMMIMMMIIVVIFDFIVTTPLPITLMLWTHCRIIIDLIQQTTWTRCRTSMCCGCDGWYARIMSRCNMGQGMGSSHTFELNRHYFLFLFFIFEIDDYFPLLHFEHWISEETHSLKMFLWFLKLHLKFKVYKYKCYQVFLIAPFNTFWSIEFYDWSRCFSINLEIQRKIGISNVLHTFAKKNQTRSKPVHSACTWTVQKSDWKSKSPWTRKKWLTVCAPFFFKFVCLMPI